jgi:hypothetical protein
MPRNFNLTPDQRMKGNILNELDENASIFRFMEINRLFELLHEKKLVLVKPFKWKDPFENFLSKTKFIDKSKNEPLEFDLTNDFYGQCWTLSNECDGMWKNYSSLENGVRIECKVLPLLKAIYDVNDEFSILSFFIGKVIYEDDKDISNKLKEWIPKILLDPSGKEIAKMLLIKRKEFKYENEVRLLSKKTLKNDDNIAFDIDPITLVNSVKFSPKMDQGDFEFNKNKLLKYGFSENQISKSTLYEPYTIEIEYDGII